MKAILGAAMLAASALAIATPANAQSTFGFYYGNGVSQRVYGERDDYRGGFRVGIRTYRQDGFPRGDFYRGSSWDRRDRDDDRGWNRRYRGR